jgi:FkbM family methyltransferase
MSAFYRDLALLCASSLNNFYPDNFDREIRKLGAYRRAVVLIETLFERLGRLLGIDAALLISGRKNFYLRSVEQFEKTYDLLKDERSRSKYIELLAYRMLGFTKVRLSLNTEEFWNARSRMEAYRRQEKIPVNFRSGYLNLYDLSDAGYDLRLYFVNNGIFLDFILQQYNYQDLVCVNRGDVVIDAGACWGDTALYFAARDAARVFAYEFIPSNLAIFEKNVSLNPRYAGRISLINKAIWETTGIDLSFSDKGPASHVVNAGVYAGSVQTLSIDDLVREQGLDKVNFIKMDVEGAELSALKGAAETIRCYKPKLAISAYHKPDDLISIPAYIQSLNPDYLFYLDYYTIIGDEIVLYAIDKHAV